MTWRWNNSETTEKHTVHGKQQWWVVYVLSVLSQTWQASSVGVQTAWYVLGVFVYTSIFFKCAHEIHRGLSNAPRWWWQLALWVCGFAWRSFGLLCWRERSENVHGSNPAFLCRGCKSGLSSGTLQKKHLAYWAYFGPFVLLFALNIFGSFEIAVITVLWYCTRMFHIVGEGLYKLEAIHGFDADREGQAWTRCSGTECAQASLGVKERCDKNTLWTRIIKYHQSYKISEPNEDFQKRDSDTTRNLSTWKDLGIMTARKRARKTTHWHLTFRTHNCSSLFHHSLNWNISYATSTVWYCLHQGCLCSISLGCARHHERHRLDHPLDSRSESVRKEVTKDVTIQWIWILFNVDKVTKAKPLCARAGVVLKWDFQQMLLSNLSIESLCLSILFGNFQVYRTAWCWPLAPLPWRITIPTVLVSLKWGPSMLFAKFTSASWSMLFLCCFMTKKILLRYSFLLFIVKVVFVVFSIEHSNANTSFNAQQNKYKQDAGVKSKHRKKENAAWPHIACPWHTPSGTENSIWYWGVGKYIGRLSKVFVDMQQDSRNGQQENLVGNRHFIGMDLSLLLPLKLSKLVVLPFAGQIRKLYNFMTSVRRRWCHCEMLLLCSTRPARSPKELRQCEFEQSEAVRLSGCQASCRAWAAWTAWTAWTGNEITSVWQRTLAWSRWYGEWLHSLPRWSLLRGMPKMGRRQWRHWNQTCFCFNSVSIQNWFRLLDSWTPGLPGLPGLLDALGDSLVRLRFGQNTTRWVALGVLFTLATR